MAERNHYAILNMKNNKIKQVATCTEDYDAANKKYVDEHGGGGGGAMGLAFNYKYSDSEDPAPPGGTITFDSADPASADIMFINTEDLDGNDLSNYVSKLANSMIVIRKPGSSTEGIIYKIKDAQVDGAIILNIGIADELVGGHNLVDGDTYEVAFNLQGYEPKGFTFYWDIVGSAPSSGQMQIVAGAPPAYNLHLHYETANGHNPKNFLQGMGGGGHVIIRSIGGQRGKIYRITSVTDNPGDSRLEMLVEPTEDTFENGECDLGPAEATFYFPVGTIKDTKGFTFYWNLIDAGLPTVGEMIFTGSAPVILQINYESAEGVIPKPFIDLMDGGMIIIRNLAGTHG